MRHGHRLPPTVVALAAGLVALSVRLPHVFVDALSQDEVASARILREPTATGLLGRVARTESTPPLWYSLAWLVHHAGMPLVDTRFISVVAGAALASLVVVLAAEHVSTGAAFTAGVLVAVGSEPVAHGAELRAYELLALLTALLAYALRRVLRHPGFGSYLALSLTVAAGALTHYFFIFSLAAGVGWLWLDPAAKRIRLRSSVFVAAGLAACSPWLPFALDQYRHNRYWWIGPYDGRMVLATPLRLFTPLLDGSVAGRLLAVSFIAASLVGAITLARSDALGRLYGALALGPLVIAAAAWWSGLHIFAVRNLIGLAPFLAIVVVSAAAAAPRRVHTLSVAALGVAAVAALAVTDTVSSPPAAALARTLVREGWRTADPVVVFGNFFAYRAPLEWYLPHQPTLAVAEPSRRSCGTVFVISRRAGSPRPASAGARASVAGYVVTRLTPAGSVARGRLRGGTILVDPATKPACVRLSTSRRLAPIT